MKIRYPILALLILAACNQQDYTPKFQVGDSVVIKLDNRPGTIVGENCKFQSDPSVPKSCVYSVRVLNKNILHGIMYPNQYSTIRMYEGELLKP